MTTYARIVSNHAVDVGTIDPATLYHPDVAAQFVTVPDGTQTGATYDPGTKKWTAPVAAAPVPTPAPVLDRLTPMTFYLAFSPAERIAIKTSTDPVVAEFWDTYQRAENTDTEVDPNLKSVQDGLAYLVSKSILASAARIPQILAGIAQ